jgi:putative membrane protein
MKPMRIPLLALAASLAFMTAACGDNDADDTAATDTTAATSAPATAAADTLPPGSHAAQFLIDAIKADNAEIAAGQTAVKMGSTDAVRDFAQMLVDDHGKSKDKASQLAMSMNVPVPSDTTPEAQSEMKMMTSMSGAGFDKDFISAMVKDHQKAIDMFQQEAGSNDEQPVKDFASQTLPTLRRHLEKAQSLQK